MSCQAIKKKIFLDFSLGTRYKPYFNIFKLSNSYLLFYQKYLFSLGKIFSFLPIKQCYGNLFQ
jgi:hypothetical protein